MTQLLNPIDLPKHQECDRPSETTLHRGGGRFDYLYGSGTNVTETRQLSPDELVSWGYRDAVKGWTRGSLGDDPHYLKGWDQGYQERKSAEVEYTIVARGELTFVFPVLRWWCLQATDKSQVKFEFDFDLQEYRVSVVPELIELLPF